MTLTNQLPPSPDKKTIEKLEVQLRGIERALTYFVPLAMVIGGAILLSRK